MKRCINDVRQRTADIVKRHPVATVKQRTDDTVRQPSVVALIALCIMVVMCFTACSGDVSKAKTHEVDSKMYSQEEIESAISVTKKYFKKNFNGCTLTEIYYAGDKKSKEFQDFADRHNADEAIVLMSSFDVDSSGGDGSLNPDSTYSDWNWILVRTDGGRWIHVDHGY